MRHSTLTAAFLGAALLSACASTQTAGLQGSPSQPAAEGSIKFEATKNDNTSIDLTVKHLAHPEKLTPPAAVYVVWVRRNDRTPPTNIGALAVDKDLTGTLTTETPLHQFELFITAEGNGQVQQPTGERQLWTSYSR